MGLYKEKTAGIFLNIAASLTRLTSKLNDLVFDWKALVKGEDAVAIREQLVNQRGRQYLRPYIKTLGKGMEFAQDLFS